MANDEPEDDNKPRRSQLERLSQLWRIVHMLRPHRARFVIATVALLLGSGLSLVYPQAAGYAVDVGIREGSTDTLDLIVLGLVALFLVSAVLTWARHYLMSWLGERVVADLRGQVFERILTLPSAWFHERRTGELVGRLASDVTVVEGVVGSEVSIALRNMVQLIGGIVLLFVVSARLTLLMLLIVPPLTVGTVAFGRIIRRMSRKVQDRLAEASGQVQESIGAIQTVQAFVREDHEARAYRRGVEEAFDQSVHLAKWRSYFFSTVMTSGYVAICAIIWLGGREVIGGNGDFTPGKLTAFLLYTVIVASALGSVASLWGSLQRAAGATERLFAIIDTVPDISDPEVATSLPDGGGGVHFRDVHFHYESRPDQPVFAGIDLKIAPGEVVALVGPSGAGKSTLTSLLLRFYDVQKGAVLFDGVDVRSLKLADLRGSMAMVAQEPVLFSGSIRDNIAYGRQDADRSAIETAAKDAHAHEFIIGFSDGYDTLVGERGVKLSGGQRQRLAIARALLADPRVLILDEATSSLDAESESLVQKALARLMEDRTTLVIAHRLSTVLDADRIVLLDGGKVAEQGTHQKLMAEKGLYRRLVEHQLIFRDARPPDLDANSPQSL